MSQEVLSVLVIPWVVIHEQQFFILRRWIELNNISDGGENNTANNVGEEKVAVDDHPDAHFCNQVCTDPCVRIVLNNENSEECEQDGNWTNNQCMNGLSQIVEVKLLGSEHEDDEDEGGQVRPFHRLE